ncbi:MAG TPA: PAS domain S-box protein [Vicinamibacterales bacterium]|jgi:PAS domain S-box-containing protein
MNEQGRSTRVRFRIGWLSTPRRTALAAALVAGLAFGAAWFELGLWRQAQSLQALRNDVQRELVLRRSALVSAVERRLALLDGLHAFVEVEVSREQVGRLFPEFAARLRTAVPGVRNLGVAPGTTYAQVYPVEGNERVLGYDLAADSRAEVREDVQLAIRSRDRVLSGPVDLVQGGLGLIARRAVHQRDAYWGLVGVAVDMQPILDEAGLTGSHGDVALAVRRPGGRAFYGSDAVFDEDPVLETFQLTNARWEIAGRPRFGWTAPLAEARRLWGLSGLVLSLVPMAFVFVVAWRQSLLRHAKLQAEQTVEERTAALAQTTDMLEAVLRASPLAIVTLDRDGRVMSWNAAAELTFGWTAAEAIGQPIPIVAPDKWPGFMDIQRRILTGGERITGIEVTRRHKDGHPIDIRLSTALMLDANRQPLGVMGVAEDVTETRAVERALHRAMLIVENSPVILVRWRHGDAWLVEYISENVAQFGYSAEDFVSGRLAWADIMLPDDLPRAMAEVAAHAGQGSDHFRLEYRIVTRDGRVRWMEDTATVGTELDGSRIDESIILDVTERRAGEDARHQVERRVREILDSVPVIAVMLDVHGGITFCNSHLLALTAWRRDEIIGRDWFEVFVPPNVRDAASRHFLEALQTGEFGPSYEHQIVTRDGEVREIVWDNTHIRDTTGAIIGSASLGRDVTEQRRLEAQYRQAQKMEAVGQLAGGVAHDFNNLLQVMSGYAGLALADLQPGQPMHSEISEIKRAADRATVLVRQLLAFSRRQTMERRAIDLNARIANLLTMLRRLIGEHIELDFRPGDGLPSVMADAGQIEQVLMNLSLNARDAMPDGGRITVATSRVTADEEFCQQRPWARGGDYVVLTVSDTGPGIPPDILEHVFEPFFTTKEVGKGSGLGLATVYGIVKQHDGLIEVISEPAHGARFVIYLPAAGDAVVDATAVRDEIVPTAPAGSVGHEMILLAEDEDLVRGLAKRVLEGAGYTVLTARDGAEAVAIFDAHRDEIALALLDVVMPRLNGPQVHAHIRARRRDVPVLYCSGYSRQMLEESTGGGADDGLDLLLKPYEPRVLLDRVRARLSRPPQPLPG